MGFSFRIFFALCEIHDFLKQLNFFPIKKENCYLCEEEGVTDCIFNIRQDLLIYRLLFYANCTMMTLISYTSYVISLKCYHLWGNYQNEWVIFTLNFILAKIWRCKKFQENHTLILHFKND